MDQVCIDSDSADDCVIEEPQVSTVEILDTTMEVTQPITDVCIDDEKAEGDNDNSINVSESCSPDTALLRLVFKDDETFDELQSTISACIRDALFALKKSIEVSVRRDECTVTFDELATGDGLNDSIFMIDTLPTERSNSNEVPDYQSGFNGVLLNGEQAPDGDDANEDKVRGMSNCWNCGGDHMLRECPEPRNADQINKSKQAFVKGKTDRYHIDADQKFAHLVPGTISEDLKQALGLRKRELPTFIYRMRMYGYPPGWLEDAKVSHSGLSLFISEVNILKF